MKFAAAVTQTAKPVEAIEALCEEAQGQLEGAKPDAAFLFISSHFEDDASKLLEVIARRYPTAMIVGSSAEGVLANVEEWERTPALALMLASLPGVELRGFRAAASELNSLDKVQAFTGSLPAEKNTTIILFGDPFTTPINPLLDAINETLPGCHVFGGMTSGAERPGQAVLLFDDVVYRDGLVGVALSGAIEIQSVVSQGCRPIGDPFVITRAEKNIIQDLGGKPALEQLKLVVGGLSHEEALLAKQSLFIGRVLNEYQDKFGRGDFLIRNLMGIDPDSGAIAVADLMQVGSTMQFHVRDRDSADEDLREMLQTTVENWKPAGALLFSCNGRGTRMWADPHHDVTVLKEVAGAIPTVGFFAAGELGPVGGKNFIHGHTASIALIGPPST